MFDGLEASGRIVLAHDNARVRLYKPDNVDLSNILTTKSPKKLRYHFWSESKADRQVGLRRIADFGLENKVHQGRVLQVLPELDEKVTSRHIGTAIRRTETVVLGATAF